MTKLVISWDWGLRQMIALLTSVALWCRQVKGWRRPGRKLRTKEQIIFFKRLSMMLRSGMPILVCLELLTEEATTITVRRLYQSLARAVGSGRTLAVALGPYESVFGQFALNMVRVGEASGTLPENLEYIASERKKQMELRKQIIGALIYPVIIVLATLGITLFLILYIFPKIVPIFLSVEATLPLATRMVMSLSSFLGSFGWWLLVAVVILSFLYPLGRKLRWFCYYTDWLLLRMPLSGRLTTYYNLAHICRTLGLLLQSEVRITAALEITARSTHNLTYQAALETTLAMIKTGQPLSMTLTLYPKLFPVLFIVMIRAGETTGNLGNTLTYLSDLYEADIRDFTKNLTTVLEPLLMLLMGLCVGFVAISIITPIYGITQNLHP